MNDIYPVFPGAILRFVEQTNAAAPKLHRHSQEHENALEINYCSDGRLGWHMKNNTMVYLGKGDISINFMSCCAHSSMEFPLGFYRGIQMILDFDLLFEKLPPVLTDMQLETCEIRRRLSQFQKPRSLSAAPEVQRIFAGMENVSDSLRLPYYRLKLQELLFFLLTFDFTEKKEVSPYQAHQTELIKEIHKFMTQNPDRRITIEELSQKYLLNTSTLKEVFKGVYGQPIASYMKEYRLKYAMELLRTTDKSIADIARQVGYGSQSKFSSAFRDYTGLLPTEYRRMA